VVTREHRRLLTEQLGGCDRPGTLEDACRRHTVSTASASNTHRSSFTWLCVFVRSAACSCSATTPLLTLGPEYAIEVFEAPMR
jgi:hypothetical protein